MKRPQSYILVLAQDSNDLRRLESLLKQLRCPVVVATSVAQAIATASQTPPYLLILAGNQQSWSKVLVNEFRSTVSTSELTIVALTDFHTPSWLRQEENPGLDGFLVKPVTGDVLVSLIQSAWARQAYCSS